MAAPLRILFPYVGDTIGGSHISSLTLAQALDPERYEVVVAVHERGQLHDYLARLGIEPVTAPRVIAPKMRPRWKQPLRVRAAAAALAPYLRAQRIDIVHTHDQRMHLAWSPAAAKAGRPHIWHQRTPSPGRHLPVFARDAARLIAVSDFVRRSFVAPARDMAEVIYNPFEAPEPHDRAAARAAIRAEMGLSEDGPVVGYVSNFSDRKRPELFVEIAARIAVTEAGDKAAFPMYGDPREPHAASVRRRMDAAGLGDRLQIMGTRFPFGPVLAGLDVLVAPARDEALGRTLIEAAMAGVPVVATDEGGTPEIFGHETSGLLVPPDDAGAFATGALRLLTDAPLAQRLTTRARADAEARFSLSAHLEKMTAIYESLRPR